MDKKKLGEASEKVVEAPNIKGPKLKPSIDEMPQLADQKDTPKGDRLNAGNYAYTNALNQPVKSLTDQLIMLLVRDEIANMLPSIPLPQPKKK